MAHFGGFVTAALWYAFVAFVFVGPFWLGLQKQGGEKIKERFVLFGLFLPLMFFFVLTENMPIELWGHVFKLSAATAVWSTATYALGLLVPHFAVPWRPRKN